MASVTELEARLETLRTQRDSAIARVSYDGRSVEYRGTAELARAIAELEKELQRSRARRRCGRSGSAPRRVSNPYEPGPKSERGAPLGAA
jgi:hypothetical protein